MTRVLWWLNEMAPDPGGIATIAALLREPLEQVDIDLTYLVTQGGPSEEVVGRTPVIRRPIWSDFLSGDLRRQSAWMPEIRAIKEQMRPDLYHVHLAEPTPLLHWLTRAVAPAPTVLTMHNDKLPRLITTDSSSLFGRLLDMSAVIVSVSSAAAAILVAARPELAARVIVIPNGVDIGAAPSPAPVAPRLLAAGRLVEQKGFDLLLRALPAVAEVIPDVQLDIAGEGVERAALEALADDLGVTAHVEFLGHVPRADLPGHMEAARVVVMPSRFEGMPLVALEAAERGRGIVGTAVGGIDEVVVDGTTGLLVPLAEVESHPETLATALVRVLSEPGLAERLGRAARDRVVDRFSIEACARTHETVYRSVGARTPAPRVSVVIPARNAERFIVAAVTSALDQTLRDLEVIVVDDGSDDATVALVEAIGDPRVTVLRQPSRGASSSRNAGLAIARGEYVAHLDADDLWPPDRLERLVAHLDAQPDTEAVFGLAREFAEPDAPAAAVVETSPRPVRMPTSGLLRMSAQQRIGPFAGRSGDQMDWSMRALADGLVYEQVDVLVLLRRIHGANMSHDRPFTRDRTRVAILKAALDRRARGAQPAGEADAPPG